MILYYLFCECPCAHVQVCWIYCNSSFSLSGVRFQDDGNPASSIPTNISLFVWDNHWCACEIIYVNTCHWCVIPIFASLRVHNCINQRIYVTIQCKNTVKNLVKWESFSLVHWMKDVTGRIKSGWEFITLSSLTFCICSLVFSEYNLNKFKTFFEKALQDYVVILQ